MAVVRTIVEKKTDPDTSFESSGNGSVRLSISCTNSGPGKAYRNSPGTVPRWFLDGF